MNLKLKIIFLFCVVTASAVTAQNVIANQYSQGTTGNNGAWNIIFDENGNYYQLTSVTFNSSSQTMGSFSVQQRGSSFSILSKFSSSHNLIWSKSYGGDSTDILTSFVKSQDGFLLCGSSNSSVSGTKTVPSNGHYHIWLQKIGYDGEVIWQKGYFTNNDVTFSEIGAIGNDEFLISSYTNSGISGDKTTNGYGGLDGWLLKIDGEGNKIWDVSIGTEYNDFGFSFGGYFDNGDALIFTNSMQGASGSKSENNYGDFNFWLVRLDSSTGELVWDKTIGSGGVGESLGNIKIINNEIFMFVSSGSGISGLRTVEKKGLEDIWFVHLNENAEILSQKSFGGDLYESGCTFTDKNNNILLAIGSNSNTSIDKTEDSRGGRDIWFLKLDLDGNILSQKTVGGNGTDLPTNIVVQPNGNYLVSSLSESGVSGEKNTPRISTAYSDVWIVELDAITLNVENLNEQNNNFLIYPNPSFNECNIAFDEPVDLRNAILYDNSGRIVLQKEFQSGKKSNYLLNVSSLAKGNYTLVLEGSDFNKTHQLVVE